jgi:Cdc6-like AAA superfamily ATPase
LTREQQDRLLIECGRVFTPATPISRRDLFAGRVDEIRKIIDTITSAGRHAILYGERGVGKTSLASILKDIFSTQSDIRISRVNCETNDTFSSVWDKALAEVPIILEGQNGNEEYTLNQWLKVDEYVGAGQIRKVLQIGNQTFPELVLVFDEFDRLAREHRVMFADTIKDLADSHTSATVVLVGVAKDVTDLIAEHASIARNIAQIRMPLMDRSEIRNILENGVANLTMRMVTEAAETIETIAQGYPHYAHLLGKEAARAAVNNWRTDINTADVHLAIKEAVKDNSYHVADEYHRATLANRKGTLFEDVLVACALANVDELGYFSSADVKPVLNSLTGKEYEIYGFSQHLNKFSSDASRGPVFEKRGSQRCYKYRFLNPVLRPYAILKGMADGTVTIDMLNRLDNPRPKKKEVKRPRAPHLMPAPKRSVEKTLFDELPPDGGQD